MTLTIEHELSVTIIGLTYGGHRAEYGYELKPSQLDEFKKLSDFAKIAGDFEIITSAILHESIIKTEYKQTEFK